MNLRLVGAAVLAAVMVVPVAAADEAASKKKRKRGLQNVATQLLKQLEEVGLTDDQVAKVTELGKAATAKIKEMRSEAGITPDIMKKIAEARKSMKDSDKKGKDLAAAVMEAAGVSDAQKAAMAKVSEVQMGLRKEVVGLLTDEQKEKLPQQLQRAAKGGKAGAKKGGKKRKKEAA